MKSVHHVNLPRAESNRWSTSLSLACVAWTRLSDQGTFRAALPTKGPTCSDEDLLQSRCSITCDKHALCPWFASPQQLTEGEGKICMWTEEQEERRCVFPGSLHLQLLYSAIPPKELKAAYREHLSPMAD